MKNKAFQQELKEKIKEGVKPSDLKKQRQQGNINNKIPNPPPPPNLEPNNQDLLKKIKELEAKNNSLTKTIEGLKVKQENKDNHQEVEQKTANYFPNESKQKYHFTCGICDQQKYSKLHLEKVNGLGLDPYKLYRICDYCINRVNVIKTKSEPRY